MYAVTPFPVDVTACCFQYLGLVELAACRRVCRQWLAIADRYFEKRFAPPPTAALAWKSKKVVRLEIDSDRALIFGRCKNETDIWSRNYLVHWLPGVANPLVYYAASLQTDCLLPDAVIFNLQRTYSLSAWVEVPFEGTQSRLIARLSPTRYEIWDLGEEEMAPKLQSIGRRDCAFDLPHAADIASIYYDHPFALITLYENRKVLCHVDGNKSLFFDDIFELKQAGTVACGLSALSSREALVCLTNGSVYKATFERSLEAHVVHTGVDMLLKAHKRSDGQGIWIGMDSYLCQLTRLNREGAIDLELLGEPGELLLDFIVSHDKLFSLSRLRVNEADSVLLRRWHLKDGIKGSFNASSSTRCATLHKDRYPCQSTPGDPTMMRLTAIPTLLAFFGASATLHVYDVLSERALPLRVISIRSPMNIITKIGLKLLKNKKEKPRRYDCTYLYGAGRQIISFFRKREVAPPYNILAYHDTVWRLG